MAHRSDFFVLDGPGAVKLDDITMARRAGIVKACPAEPTREQAADDPAVDHAETICAVRENGGKGGFGAACRKIAALTAGAYRIFAALFAPGLKFRIFLQIRIAAHLKMAEVNFAQAGQDVSAAS